MGKLRRLLSLSIFPLLLAAYTREYHSDVLHLLLLILLWTADRRGRLKVLDPAQKGPQNFRPYYFGPFRYFAYRMHFHFTKISMTKPANNKKSSYQWLLSRRVLYRSFKTQNLMQTLPIMAIFKYFFLRQRNFQVYCQLKKQKPTPKPLRISHSFCSFFQSIMQKATNNFEPTDKILLK